MNSINWPASSVWVFIAQLGEHCNANAEATGSNPVEAPEIFFFGLFSQLLKLRFTAMVTYSFHLYSRSSHYFIQYANFIYALSTRTASRNSSNFWSLFCLFSVGLMKGGRESKELCSVFGLGLRLNGGFSRNFVYCCMRVYLRRVLADAEKKSPQLPQY